MSADAYGPMCALCGDLPVICAEWLCEGCAEKTEDERALVTTLRRERERAKQDAAREEYGTRDLVKARRESYGDAARGWARSGREDVEAAIARREVEEAL